MNFEHIKKNIRGKIRENVSLKNYNTWKVGGKAEYFFEPYDLNDLKFFLANFQKTNITFLGNGSNVLIRDGGIQGCVICLKNTLKDYEVLKDGEMSFEAGFSCMKIAQITARNNLSGLEFLCGVPGSLGGALAMNAGCYGSETVDVINSIEICDNFGQRKTITKDKLNLKYRSSKINNTDIVTKAIFNFNYGDQNLIKDKINKIKNKRLESQPIKNKTSGSTFKNPENLHAAKLIEEAGCKGTNFGDAYVSDKHANFLINMGSASATDIENLGKSIVEKVYAKFNVKLEWEVKIIGE